MRVIFKYDLAWADNFGVVMPRGARILSVGIQEGALKVWAIVDPEARKVRHLFTVKGTGFTVEPEVEQSDFIGTVFHGPGVWHVFSLGDVDD